MRLRDRYKYVYNTTANFSVQLHDVFSESSLTLNATYGTLDQHENKDIKPKPELPYI